MSSSERRRSPRVPLLSGAWIVLDDERTHVQTRDLSRGGVCCSRPERPLCGEELRLELRLPDVEGELVLLGTVAWRRGDDFGLEFDEIAEEHAALIEATVQAVLDELDSLEREKTPSR